MIHDLKVVECAASNPGAGFSHHKATGIGPLYLQDEGHQASTALGRELTRDLFLITWAARRRVESEIRKSVKIPLRFPSVRLGRLGY